MTPDQLNPTPPRPVPGNQRRPLRFGDGSRPAAPPAEPMAATPTLGPTAILLVDDEERNLEVLESLLPSPDYRLVRALTAEEALLLLLKEEFAVIVLDIQMPGMTGIELATLIKQRRRTQDIPIIFLTAYFQEENVLEGYGTGAVDYLTKPVNPRIFQSKIAVFVDLFRKTRALELEIDQRQKAEAALREANNALDARVQARTADLILMNEELREHEAALRASEAEAMAASRAKDDFLAALSHELRTPLNPVLLLATDSANNALLPAQVRADFATIAKHVALEARLIDDMLDLTQIAHGKVALELRPCDIHAGIHEVLAMVREEIDQKQIALTLRLSAARSQVRGDDVRLKQVFWNVIKNAAKFTPPAGRITIGTDVVADGTLAITVTDSGIGMSSAELGRIFEAFSQGSHAAPGGPRRFGGMGLGLAISRRMVEMHDGIIRAHSPGLNLGAVFTIELPLLPETAAEPLPAAGPTPAPASDKPTHTRHRIMPRRILLVEDHKPTSRVLHDLLTRRHYAVVATACLAEARAVASRESFELLISDIGLPDGNGYDLMAELHGRHGLVGIALTGYGMEDDVSRSQAAGFAAHLTKPITVEALDGALATAADRLNL